MKKKRKEETGEGGGGYKGKSKNTMEHFITGNCCFREYDDIVFRSIVRRDGVENP